MTIYDKKDSLRQTELDMYGSSRLGTVRDSLNMQCVDDSITLGGDFGKAKTYTFNRGNKFFELVNHLGNVLATVTDKKLAVDSNSDGLTDYYTADIANAQDYYPFGWPCLTGCLNRVEIAAIDMDLMGKRKIMILKVLVA